MIRCVVIDDKPLAIDILKEYINKISFLQLLTDFRNPLEAIEFVQQNEVDLIFLDIQMPELNGIAFLKILGGRTKVILSTAYAEYALEGYEHDIVDYLLKPVSFERFYKAVDKANQVIRVNQSLSRNAADDKTQLGNFIFIKTEYKMQRIFFEDILYIEARQNYIAVITQGDQIMSLQNIKTIEGKLPSNKFIRIHKSYIVSIEKVDTVEKGSIRIRTHSIPIGDSYRSSFFKKIER